MTLEATEVVVLSDERHRRVIVVEELLAEIASLKKRVLEMEERYESNFAEPRREARRARELEASRKRHRVGRPEDADTNDLLQSVEEDYGTGLEDDVDANLVRAVVAAADRDAVVACAAND